jgi:predicted small secreted protein
MTKALLLAVLLLSGCNTIAGLGRDITGGAERVGQMF